MIIFENVSEINYNKYEHICVFMLIFYVKITVMVLVKG